MVAVDRSHASTLVGTVGDASGIDGLSVDGVLYDVTFEHESYNAIFLETPPIFLNNQKLGDAASDALAAALHGLGVWGLMGISSTKSQTIATPVAFPLPAYRNEVFASLVLGGGKRLYPPTTPITNWEADHTFRLPTELRDSFVYPRLDYAVWTTATPIPAALPLFATGLGMSGLFGWRRKRNNTAALAA
jgi:hypothetical protein